MGTVWRRDLHGINHLHLWRHLCVFKPMVFSVFGCMKELVRVGQVSVERVSEKYVHMEVNALYILSDS